MSKSIYTIPVGLEDVIAKVKLPEKEYFKPASDDVEECPYYKLHVYVARDQGIPIEEHDVSTVCVQPNVTKVLEKYTKAWIKKVAPYLRVKDHQFEVQLGMTHLMWGPVDIDEEWASDEYAYVRVIRPYKRTE